MRSIFFTLVSALLAVVPASGQDQSVERSSLFALENGDQIEDAGVIRVAGGRFARTESFEVVRRADGGRTITSVITGADGSYRVEGKWVYDANDTARSAEGRAVYDGTPATIMITSQPPVAVVSVSSGAVARTIPAPCDPDCLIDMAPSTLPMFTMTRLFDPAGPDTQTFRWIGQGLTVDQVLLEGAADLELVDTGKVEGMTVSQYKFVERLTDAESGAQRSFAFNLWVDDGQRPIAFGTAGGTLGVRDGYESVPAALPGQFD